MKVQSSIYPEKFYIRKIELGDVYVKLRKNIEEIELKQEDGEGVDKVYEYDEVEVIISNRKNIDKYVEGNFEKLFAKGVEEELRQDKISDKERIEALEEALLIIMEV